MSATKVLIVEDDPLIRRMYDRALSLQGYSVTLALDGTIVFETVQINRPDIIILDVMMPNYNGLETLKELKSRRSTQSIPVLMLSARDDPAIIKAAMDAGAGKYLVKNAVELSDIAAAIDGLVAKPVRKSVTS